MTDLAAAVAGATETVLATSAPDACIGAFRSVLPLFGIDTFASGEVDTLKRQRNVFYVIDWPDDWRRFYFGSGMIDRDPLIAALGRRDSAFTWSELRADRGLSQAGTESLERIAAAGWTDGLLVSMPRGGARFGIVSLVARDKRITAVDKALLVPFSICFHDRLRGMLGAHSFPVPPAGLTPRELDCVRLVATGHSDRKIAAVLGITAATVHHHVESAKARLDAGTRAELVAVVVSLGVVSA